MSPGPTPDRPDPASRTRGWCATRPSVVGGQEVPSTPGAGGEQGGVAGAQAAARGVRQASAGMSPSISRSTARRRASAGSRRWGAAVDTTRCSSTGFAPDRGPDRRGRPGLRLHPAQHQPRADPGGGRGGGRGQQRAGPRDGCARSTSCLAARSARTRRCSIRWRRNWMELPAGLADRDERREPSTTTADRAARRPTPRSTWRARRASRGLRAGP